MLRCLELPVEIGDVRKPRAGSDNGNGQGSVSQHAARVPNANPGDIPPDALTNMLDKVTCERAFRQAGRRTEFRQPQGFGKARVDH